ncbi:MAG: tRNA pseudouridine(38-40) synthase TruA [Desulfobacterales bacterium]|nr:tRNA pseudouridine(38-40) synthase TruA [Desulfobacterales bacterium]
MIKNFKIIVEYDGTQYAGWQRQKESLTIQGEIEKAISKMTDQHVTLHGSGRTDAGVHALGQVANFSCDTRLTPDIFFKGLNSILPNDIVIKSCEQKDERFHARFSAKSKIYNYRILNQILPSAINRNYIWFINKKLHYDAMHEATDHIIGSHDFKSFENTGSPRNSTIRNVISAKFLEKESNLLVFEIEANGFLKFMVRNLVGTLVYVGLQKITPDEFKQILLSKNRKLAAPTAPPQGLFLMQVKY